jgi:hypothetical protein
MILKKGFDYTTLSSIDYHLNALTPTDPGKFLSTARHDIVARHFESQIHRNPNRSGDFTELTTAVYTTEHFRAQEVNRG